jgi:hypothetical protein
VVKVIKLVKTGEEVSRSTDLVAIGPGQTICICENANNGTLVVFRVFRRDYDTSGEYTETKVLEETYNAPLAPTGPR